MPSVRLFFIFIYFPNEVQMRGSKKHYRMIILRVIVVYLSHLFSTKITNNRKTKQNQGTHCRKQYSPFRYFFNKQTQRNTTMFKLVVAPTKGWKHPPETSSLIRIRTTPWDDDMVLVLDNITKTLSAVKKSTQEQLWFSPMLGTKEPNALTITPNGETAFITDAEAGTIQHVSLMPYEEGKPLHMDSKIGIGTSIAAVAKPRGITFSAQRNRLYVSSESGSVHVFEPMASNLVASQTMLLSSMSARSESFDNAAQSALAVQTEERPEAIKWKEVAMWFKEGEETSQLDNPSGMCLYKSATGAEELYVSDTNNHRIQAFDSSTGKFIRQYGTPGQYGNEPNMLFFPEDVSVTPDGKLLLVADYFNRRIAVFRRSNGEWIGSSSALPFSPYTVSEDGCVAGNDNGKDPGMMMCKAMKPVA